MAAGSLKFLAAHGQRQSTYEESRGFLKLHDSLTARVLKKRVLTRELRTVHHNEHVSSQPFEAGRHSPPSVPPDSTGRANDVAVVVTKCPIDAAPLAKAGESPAA